ncbi:MAG: single-stranded-DNA-specific exonuclease RecJ [Flavobacteriales bacterium]|nr:single-stranded-DNA-specific exonuclease RecJ [Flavobacteriales bacterium]
MVENITLHRRIVLKPSPPQELIRRLGQQLNIHPVFLRMLVRQGVVSFEGARDFFRPHLGLLHDPYLMKDMEPAVGRVLSAIANRERILFWGDYDVDGTTATALMVSFFKDFLNYTETGYYIPDRYNEGYGISSTGLRFAADNGFSLLVALDCGTLAVAEASEAQSLGLDLIVCDHHRPGPVLPQAVAVLNPKRPDCSYPFRDLSGCGVAFKLVQALAAVHGIPAEELQPLTDLVAISTCADIVDLTDENRVLVYTGLQQIRQHPRPAVRLLAEILEKNPEEFTSEDIVFGLGPRLNAAGRIEHGRLAVSLLLENDEEHLRQIAARLENLNQERRQYDRQITLEAYEDLLKQQITKFSVIAYRPHWHKGVVGIVAARLVERFYLPAIVLTNSEGKITGSARSIPGFDLFEALSRCAEHLENFGGHAFAAGLTLSHDKLQAFMETFDQIASEMLGKSKPCPIVEVDDEIDFRTLTPAFVNLKNQFGPFGPGNMDPVFLARGLRLYDNEISEFGEGHLRFKVRQPACCPTAFPVVAYKMASLRQLIQQTESFDMAFNVSLFGKNKIIELEAKSIIPSALECQ